MKVFTKRRLLAGPRCSGVAATVTMGSFGVCRLEDALEPEVGRGEGARSAERVPAA